MFRLLCFVLDVFDFAEELLDGDLSLLQRLRVTIEIINDIYNTAINLF